MLNIRSMLIDASQLQRNKRQDLVAQRRELEPIIRGYFDGDFGEADIYRVLHGRTSFDLMRVTSPEEEFWRILMQALDVVIGMHPEESQVRRISHGVVTQAHYIDAISPVPRKDKYGW
jgi:hypothetical protein